MGCGFGGAALSDIEVGPELMARDGLCAVFINSQVAEPCHSPCHLVRRQVLHATIATSQ
jgi:hypothetical protein